MSTTEPLALPSVSARLAEVWRAVLGTAPGPDDDFFRLGGTSLRAALLTARLRAVGIELTIVDVLEHPRFEDLAQYLDADRAPDAARPSIPVVPRVGDLPLSHGQEADLIGMLKARRGGGSAESCLLPFAVELTGVTETDVRRALREVVARHESLRTGFVLDDAHGTACPFVVPAVGIGPHLLEVADAAAPDDDLAQAAADAVRRLVTGAPTVDDAPLVRFVLVRAGGRLGLVGVVDHLVCDWHGIMIVLDDLAARLNGVRPDPAPARPDFLDWAAWQRDRLAGPEGEELLKFWRRDLAACGPLPELVVPRPQGPATYETYVRLEHEFAEEQWQAFREAGRRRGAGRLPVVLTLWARAWSRVLGGAELLAHVPTPNRGHAGAASIVGPMAHTLPVRLRGRSDAPPLAHLDELAAGYRAALDHQEAPLCWLTEQLAPVDHAPAVQPRRLFVADEEGDTPSWTWTGASMRVVSLPWAPGAAHDGVSVNVVDEGATGRVTVILNGTLVDVPTVQRVMDVLPSLAAELTAAHASEGVEPVGESSDAAPPFGGPTTNPTSGR